MLPDGPPSAGQRPSGHRSRALHRVLGAAMALLAGLLLPEAAQSATPASATPVSLAIALDAERATVARGLEAQYQAALIRERRLADDRELRQIADAEATMRRLRAEQDKTRDANTRLQTELETARTDYAKLVRDIAEREARAQAEIAAYRAEAQGLAARATPEKLTALQRFADGDRTGAWPVLKEITEASVKARMAAAAKAAAQELRELARLREIMRENGEARAQEVLVLWDEAATLDPTDVWTHVFRARLATELGELKRAAGALETAMSVVRDDREQAVILNELGNVHVSQGQLGAALQRFEQGLAIAQRLAQADPSSATLQRDLSVSLNEIGDVLVAQGQLGAALQRFEQGLAIRQRLAQDDPSSATLQRDLSISYWKLASIHNTTDGWQRVISQMESMKSRGMLRPADETFFSQAQQRLLQAQRP